MISTSKSLLLNERQSSSNIAFVKIMVTKYKGFQH